jgi:CheY-like chemotaxis protein
MTFSRAGHEAHTRVDVNAAVDVAIKMALHEIKYRARLVRELGDIASVEGNDGKLSQVFLNLLLNAARAIEEGHPDRNEIGARTWMQDDEVKVEIWDTGQGIAPEHLEHLFEPFFSTRPAGAGAGLGLSICLSVVRAHGGRIDVRSEPGRGSRFVVSLPRATRPSVEPSLAPSSERVPETRLKVLIVDDEAMVLRVLGQLLSHHYEVQTAEGLTAACELLARGSFDVVLCDMMMLDGTGADLHAWAVENRSELAERFVFMTGGTFTPKAREFLAAIDAPRLSKPFQLRELQEILTSLPKRV